MRQRGLRRGASLLSVLSFLSSGKIRQLQLQMLPIPDFIGRLPIANTVPLGYNGNNM